jgi:membrane protein implicated in regulation of membrane protease activity
MDALVFWHWWVLGFGLLIAEILLPGTFCLWLGLAAFVTGAAAWLIPGLHWQVEVVLFAVLAFAAVGLWFRFKPADREQVDHGLNQRGRGYLGQVFVLVEPIEDGVGKARVEDSVWRVHGPDLPAGAKVKVVGIEGTTLRVKPA